jgi:hypothetical protein
MTGLSSTHGLSGPRLIDRTKKQKLNAMSTESEDGSSAFSTLSDSMFVGVRSRSSTPIDDGQMVAPSAEDPEIPLQPKYREAAEAPDTFKQQVQILLEEKIYHIAIQQLQSNLSMLSYQTSNTPYWVAPPNHLALIGTLAIHPKFTTHAGTDNESILPARAHQYLRDVLRAVGPVNGKFNLAFIFRDGREARTSRRRRGLTSAELRDATPEEDELKSPLANGDSLWSRVPDFWSMLSWAFNCSVAYSERWGHWKLWLEFMLELLERDVEERKTLDEEQSELNDTSSDDEACQYPLLKDSIMMSYIGDFTLNQIMRVLFSFLDGEPHPAREVWTKETKTRAETTKIKQEKKLDLDKHQFGDYLDDEDESMDDADATTEPKPSVRPKRSRGRPKASKKAQRPPLVANPLLEQTIPIRRRIFGLLSFLCHYLQDEAPFNIYDLYERFAMNIRDLPLDVYPHFVWSEVPFKEGVYITIVRHLLAKLLPPEAPKPGEVDPDTDNVGSLSPGILEKCFLPYASNRVVADNAKLAVLLWETFIYMFDKGVGPTLSPGMREAILKGIAEREAKSNVKAAKTPRSVVDEEALDDMLSSMVKKEYSAENVMRFAHLKFMFVLEKMKEADRQQGYTLGGEFLGWK